MIGRQSESLVIDGIATRVSVLGTGPPLLMFSPGGFDATLDKWSELGVYQKIDIMSYLTNHFTCILFDRRECGESGGRLEILDFVGMANQGRVLMEQLGYASIHVIPTATNMIHNNLRSANPPPGAIHQYPGTNRDRNNYIPMPGVFWYNDTHHVNQGPYSIKVIEINQ